jgi:hypothetical protein
MDLSQQKYLFSHDGEFERNSYNLAFSELGLEWYWDAQTYEALVKEEKGQVRAYLESRHPHLLRAYDADFLLNAIETRRRGIIQARPT